MKSSLIYGLILIGFIFISGCSKPDGNGPFTKTFNYTSDAGNTLSITVHFTQQNGNIISGRFETEDGFTGECEFDTETGKGTLDFDHPMMINMTFEERENSAQGTWDSDGDGQPDGTWMEVIPVDPKSGIN